jgi:hypothetical protein
MKLVEATIFGGVAFTAIYVILAFILRVFHITSDYNAHMVAGIIGTIVGIVVFILLLKRKKEK